MRALGYGFVVCQIVISDDKVVYSVCAGLTIGQRKNVRVLLQVVSPSPGQALLEHAPFMEWCPAQPFGMGT